MILFCGGLLATFGSRALDISGAGALGCLSMAFVAALGWRKEISSEEEVCCLWLINITLYFQSKLPLISIPYETYILPFHYLPTNGY